MTYAEQKSMESMEPAQLTGQSIIGGKSHHLGIDRITHYQNNAALNAAATSMGGILEPASLAKQFTSYRHAWKAQPAEWAEEIKKQVETNSFYEPLSLDIELAAICDLACPYCYRQALVTPDKIMDTALAMQLIDQAVELGVSSIKFNWRGEPLLHPKIFEIVSYAKKRGIPDVIINTNATQLHGDKIDQLILSGIDYVIFSFDGGTKETYEKNRLGRFGTNLFEAVRDNIQNFCMRKEALGRAFPWTRVQMVLTPEAINEQEEYLNLFNDCVDEVCVNNYDERGMGADLLSDTDKQVFLAKVSDYNLNSDTHYMKIGYHEILVSTGRKPCDQPFQRMLVTYDGRVSMCCFDWGSRHTVGYVSDAAFQDLDYDKRRVQELIHDKAKGFELISKAVMPIQLYKCESIVKPLREIWKDEAISHIRHGQSHGSCDASICQSCTYRGSHTWI